MTMLPASTEKKLGLVIDLDICVGCHACAVACKSWNSTGTAAPLSDITPYGAEATGTWLNRIHSFEVDDGEGGFAEGYFKNHLTGTNPTFFEQSTGALLNSGGVIANGAEFKVIYDDSSTKYGTGTVTDTVREAGLAP